MQEGRTEDENPASGGAAADNNNPGIRYEAQGVRENGKKNKKKRKLLFVFLLLLVVLPCSVVLVVNYQQAGCSPAVGWLARCFSRLSVSVPSRPGIC